MWVAAPFQRSALTFTGLYSGQSHAWTFERQRGEVIVVDALPTSLTVKMESASVVASGAALRRELLSSAWLDAAKFSSALLRVPQIQPTSGDGKRAELSLRGTIEVAGRPLPFTTTGTWERNAADTTLRLSVRVSGREVKEHWGEAASKTFTGDLQLDLRLSFPKGGGAS